MVARTLVIVTLYVHCVSCVYNADDNDDRGRSKGEHTVPEYVCNVMAHAQKPDFVLRRKGRVHLNRQGRPFSRLLAAEVCASAVVMLDTPCSEVE